MSLPSSSLLFFTQDSDRQKLSFQYFQEALQLEERGRLSEAINLYNIAYKLDPDVELAYNKTFKGKTISEIANTQEKIPISLSSSTSFLSKKIYHSFTLKELEDITKNSNQRSINLPIPIILNILLRLGGSRLESLELFAFTSKESYRLSRDNLLWKCLYILSQRKEQDESNHLISESKKEKNNNSFHSPLIPPHFPFYRNLYFENYRVRMDGIYISKMTYFRPGYLEDAFSQPVHVITYWRYLRFFGYFNSFKVLTLVSTLEPIKVIDLLRNVDQSQHSNADQFNNSISNTFLSKDNKELVKGLKVGIWKMESVPSKCSCHSNEEKVVILSDENEKETVNRMKMEFLLTGKYKWKSNLMKCIKYEIKTRKTFPLLDFNSSSFPSSPAPFNNDDTVIIDTEDWNKFCFSKVRSYFA